MNALTTLLTAANPSGSIDLSSVGFTPIGFIIGGAIGILFLVVGLMRHQFVAGTTTALALLLVGGVSFNINYGKPDVEALITQMEESGVTITAKEKELIQITSRAADKPQNVTAKHDGAIGTVVIKAVKEDDDYFVSWELESE